MWLVLVVCVVLLLAVGALAFSRASRDVPSSEREPTAGQAGSGRSEAAVNGPRKWSEIATLAETDGPTVDFVEDEAMGVPEMLFDPVVGTVAVWPRLGDLEVRVKPPGAAQWRKAHVLQDDTEAKWAEAPMLASDGDGAVTLAWVRTLKNTNVQVVATTRSPAGDWSAPTVLWRGPYLENAESGPVLDPHLAMGPDGSAAVGWTMESLTDPEDEDTLVYLARAAYRPAGSEWQYSVALSRHDDVDLADAWVDDVAVDSQGVATVVVSGTSLRTMRTRGGPWRNGEVIMGGGKSGGADLAVSRNGSADVVFGRRHDILASSLDSARWMPPVRIAPRLPSDLYYGQPVLTQHSEMATLAFASWDGPVQVVTRAPDGKYSPPARIPRSTGAQLDVLGVWSNEAGQALAIFGPYGEDQGDGAAAWVLHASYRANSDGPWSTPIPLSEGKATTEDLIKQYAGVTAVVHPDGTAVALWSDGYKILARTLSRSE